MSAADSAARPPRPGRGEHAGRIRCDPSKALVTGGAEHRQNAQNSEGVDVSSGIMLDRAGARDRDDAIWVVPAGDGASGPWRREVVQPEPDHAAGE
jgi:hypothetical protein